jgi:hypothetical protein
METSRHPISTITQLQTRFLCPFFLRRTCVEEALGALVDVTVTGRGDQSLNVWVSPHRDKRGLDGVDNRYRESVHDLYCEEVLDHVVDFLFPGKATARAMGCGYFMLSRPVADRWFGGLEVLLPHGAKIPVRLVPLARIELFLSNLGVGVLSLAFEPDRHPLTIAEAYEFNYRLSLLRWSNAGTLHMPHPSEDKPRWDRLSDAARQNIPAAPACDASVSERLGRAGGSFTMLELIDELLRPIDGFRRDEDVEPLSLTVQDRLSVYTVARFGAEIDFEERGVRTACAPILSGLAQVEESNHAGSPADSVGVANAILNRRHWAGVGLLGAAHLVVDQEPPEHPFNVGRVPRIFLKYFIPYVVAALQRHSLHRTVDEANDIVLHPGQDPDERLAELRDALLRFAVQGHFTQVSHREALHRYYRLCQEGMDVPQALDDARRAVSDLDAKRAVERQLKIAADMAENVAATRQLQQELGANVEATKGLQQSMDKNIGVVARVQTVVEVLEIFIISVYAAHLWHMLSDLPPEKLVNLHVPHQFWTWEFWQQVWNGEFWQELGHLLAELHYGVLFWAVVGALVVMLIHRWLHRVKHES